MKGGFFASFCLISAIERVILTVSLKKNEIRDRLQEIVFIFASFKQKGKNGYKMTMYYLHTTTFGMGSMMTSMSASTTMTPGG